MLATRPLPQALDDEALVARALEGDERAFTALYRAHVRPVARTIYSLVRDETEVDDILQRAFAEACTRLDTLREPRGFRSWVTRIAVRDSWDYLRARRRRTWLSCALEAILPKSSAPADLAPAAALYEAVESLALKLRVPWTLHAIDGYTFEEVASLCDVGLNTAKRRVRLAQDQIDRRFHE